ncbi:MAG: hypothetical protein PHE96_12925 [Methylococcales bacterium]|nr:hypothetical protein [Methylococcales bacterium]
MPRLKNEIPTDEELRSYFMEYLGLLSSGYASEYPGCDSFCMKARESIFESLCRLNRLPRSDSFWSNTNFRPTIYKLGDFCRLVLKSNPQDTLALWTIAALDVSNGVDGFGYKQWKVLCDLGNFDVTWPICAALLQGGPGGISDTTLATLLLDMDVVEAARPLLQQHADSARPNIRAWAENVLGMLQGTSARRDT